MDAMMMREEKSSLGAVLRDPFQDSVLLDALDALLWSPTRRGDNLLIMPYLVDGERRVSIANHEDGSGQWDEIADAPTLREAIEVAAGKRAI